MDINTIFEEIARDNNTTPQAVENEIRYAIQEAMKSKDPKAQMLWKQISPDGKEPSIERFLQFVSNIIDERSEKWYKRL